MINRLTGAAGNNDHSDAGARARGKSESKRPGVGENSPDEDPANWRRVKEAGVAFWINDITGMATDENPCSPLQPIAVEGTNPLIVEDGVVEDDLEGVVEIGTGALVYDRSEFEQTMRILDDYMPRGTGNDP